MARINSMSAFALLLFCSVLSAKPTQAQVSSWSQEVCALCSCSDHGTSIYCSTDQLNASFPFADTNVAPDVTSMFITRGDKEDEAILELRDSLLGRSFPNLRSLSFSSCSIGNVENGAFDQMPYLQELIFNENSLRDIPRAVKVLSKSLERLEITDQGELTTLHSNRLDKLHNLSTLDLSSNNIRKLDSHSFMGLNKLEVLSLTQNNIENIEKDVFSSTFSLKELDLSLNKLRYVPASINNLVQLQKLDLSFNNISNVHRFGFVANMPNLTTLNLRGNAISLVDDISVDVLINSSLVDIRLCDNPYRCNKTLCGFMLYVKIFLSFPSYSGVDPFWNLPTCTYTCGSPLRYWGSPFDNVYGELCTISIPTPTSVPQVVEKNRKSVRVIAIVLGVVIASGVAFGFVVYFALRRLRHLRRGFIFAGQGYIKFKNRRNAEIRFDALVYNHINETYFVDQRLRPRLEDPPNDFRLCLPLTRDFRLGAKKLNNLRESIISSRCAIFVISEAFVQDVRCKQALEVACEFLHRDDLGPAHLKQTGLILIVLDPVLLDQLPETLRVLVDRLVTLEWENLNEERCWKRLEQTLLQFREPNEI